MKRVHDPVMRMQLLVCLVLFVATSIVLWVFFGWFVAMIPMYIVILGGLTVATRYLMHFQTPSKNCAKCGYDLHGLSSAEVSDQKSEVSRVCPECGAER